MDHYAALAQIANKTALEFLRSSSALRQHKSSRSNSHHSSSPLDTLQLAASKMGRSRSRSKSPSSRRRHKTKHSHKHRSKSREKRSNSKYAEKAREKSSKSRQLKLSFANYLIFFQQFNRIFHIYSASLFIDICIFSWSVFSVLRQ